MRIKSDWSKPILLSQIDMSDLMVSKVELTESISSESALFCDLNLFTVNLIEDNEVSLLERYCLD